MALVFGDSFDHYLIADMEKKGWAWSGNGNHVTIETAAREAISSTYALPPHAMGFGLVCTESSGWGCRKKTLPAALATFISGFYWKTSTIASASLIVAFYDSATPANIHVSVRYDTSGHITLCRDATVLATSTNVIVPNTWYHIEVKVTIADATNGCYEVRVNGSDTDWIPAVSNGDTRNSGNASIIAVALHPTIVNSISHHHAFQDFYILDTTGAQASDFLGPSRFVLLRPVGAGNSAQLTGNYADNWLNVVESDGDSAFNQSATAGHIDLFTMTDVPAGTIHAIQHVLYARQDAGVQRVLRPKTRIGGTNYDGASINLASSYVMYTEPVMFSPATGGSTAWDDAELNGAEFGYEVVS